MQKLSYNHLFGGMQQHSWISPYALAQTDLFYFIFETQLEMKLTIDRNINNARAEAQENKITANIEVSKLMMTSKHEWEQIWEQMNGRGCDNNCD